MLKTKKNIALAGSILAIFAANMANAGTLESLIEQQRQAMQEESNMKLEKAKINPLTAPPLNLQETQGAPTLPRLPALPINMPLPGSGVAAIEKPIAVLPLRVIFKISDTKLLAVYGVGPNLSTEIEYNGYVAKVKKDDPVIDGWQVHSIEKDKVVLRKFDKNNMMLTHELYKNQIDQIITREVDKPVVETPAKKIASANVSKKGKSKLPAKKIGIQEGLPANFVPAGMEAPVKKSPASVSSSTTANAASTPGQSSAPITLQVPPADVAKNQTIQKSELSAKPVK